MGFWTFAACKARTGPRARKNLYEKVLHWTTFDYVYGWLYEVGSVLKSETFSYIAGGGPKITNKISNLQDVAAVLIIVTKLFELHLCTVSLPVLETYNFKVVRQWKNLIPSLVFRCKTAEIRVLLVGKRRNYFSISLKV